MKLLLIAKGQWTVYAICSEDSTCALLDFIDGLDRKLGAKVLSDLRESVPWGSVAHWARTKFSWKLRGSKVLEFRWPTKGGGTPRVLWFFDAGQVIVCCHGLSKKGNSLDRSEIEFAEAAMARYFRSKAVGTLTVVELADLDDEK